MNHGDIYLLGIVALLALSVIFDALVRGWDER